MKILFKILLFVAILGQGCVNDKQATNQFSSSSDTLHIRTEKQKGAGLFSLGVSDLYFKDTIAEFPNSVVYPKQISNIKRMQMPTDFRAEEAHYVEIMIGIIGEKEIFIVDENNNKDFTDDSIRFYKPIKWRSNDDLIKSKYLISNGQKIVEDSSWIKIGTLSNSLCYGRSEHLIANFTINKEKYKVGVIDSRSGCFTYGVYPEIALLSHNSETKDTLFQKDILKLGELLFINGNYYRFENITNIGEYITLTKETNFDKEIGTQVGMMAPEFNCHSIDGDSISLNNYKGKYLLLINVSACWSKISSYKCYLDLTETFKNKFEFIGIDDSPIALENNIKDLKISSRFVIAPDNPMIRKSYRPDVCSRTCFLIGPDGRIIDNFEIFDWEAVLKKHFN
jgi:peroxiredoxin